jgi:hypothetical protein
MEHAKGQVERQILEVVLTGSFNADKTGHFHGVGKLALSGAATNDRLGLDEKKSRKGGCNTVSKAYSTG